MGTSLIKPLFPPILKPGDSIGIAAPSSPFKRNQFFKGIRVLESFGFKTYIPEDLFKSKGYLAGSDKHRAVILNRLFADKNIDAIICAKGGYGSIRILKLIDYSLIRNNPKVFIGMSDSTTLLSAIYEKSGLLTFHGPMVNTLVDAPMKTKQALFTAISSDNRIVIPSLSGVTIKRGTVSGPIYGGNIATLCHLVGTPFAPKFKDHILFLEDRREKSYMIETMLLQMKLSGCFKGIVGVILGSFEECGPIEEIYRIVDDIFIHYEIPILAGFEAGHGKQNITIPIGIECTLDADTHVLSFHRTATRHKV